MATSAREIKEIRADYAAAKRDYHRAGKKAFGKPANSSAKKEYKAARAVYKRVGTILGKATGRKRKSGKK